MCYIILKTEALASDSQAHSRNPSVLLRQGDEDGCLPVYPSSVRCAVHFLRGSDGGRQQPLHGVRPRSSPLRNWVDRNVTANFDGFVCTQTYHEATAETDETALCFFVSVLSEAGIFNPVQNVRQFISEVLYHILLLGCLWNFVYPMLSERVVVSSSIIFRE